MMLRKTVQVLTFLTLCLIIAGSAWAGNRAGATTFSLNAGLYQYEGDQGFDDESNVTFGLGVGYNLTDHLGLEANVNLVGETDVSGTSNEVDGILFRVEALYHFMPDQRLVPFVAIGAGNMLLDYDHGDNEDTFGASYGAGLKYFINEDFALRLDARHFIGLDQGLDEGNHTDNNLLLTAGVAYQLGGKQAAPAPRDSDGDGVTDDLDQCPDTPQGVAVDAKGCPLDSDSDGVPDYLDKCPGTPRGAVVNSMGCELDSDGDGVVDSRDRCPDTPANVQVDADGCPLDSDGDGVPDYLDKCPGTPPNTPVDADGCPLDSDGDGVYDSLDRCPGTPRGIMVDEKGCPISFNLLIEFDTNKADIRPEYHNRLQEAADFIAKNPAPQILVAGHTDSLGSENYNLQLSDRRAANVRLYLIDHFNINPEKLVAKGYGESQPVASNDTQDGRQRNRRVEVVCCTIIPK
ncbi:MAG: OmpA family protein [Desulfuromonadaceae bacterium]